MLVLVIRLNDVAFDVDSRDSPMDAINTLRDEMPALLQHLIDDRAKRKENCAGAQQGEAGK